MEHELYRTGGACYTEKGGEMQQVRKAKRRDETRCNGAAVCRRRPSREGSRTKPRQAPWQHTVAAGTAHRTVQPASYAWNDVMTSASSPSMACRRCPRPRALASSADIRRTFCWHSNKPTTEQDVRTTRGAARGADKTACPAQQVAFSHMRKCERQKMPVQAQ